MTASRLRIYYGPEQDTLADFDEPRRGREEVTVPLQEILPLLQDAVRCERTWLRDFLDDEITISHDLYDVILAYQHHRRPTA